MNFTTASLIEDFAFVLSGETLLRTSYIVCRINGRDYNSRTTVFVTLPDPLELGHSGLELTLNLSNIELSGYLFPGVTISAYDSDDVLLVNNTSHFIIPGFIEPDVNSYCSLSEADAYHLTRIFTTDDWFNGSEVMREFYLKAACDLLDTMNWAYNKSDNTQTLAWPRYIDGISVTPREIKYAQAEIALQLMNGETIEKTPVSIKISAISIVDKKTSLFSNDTVRRLLAPYLSYSPKLVRT